MYEYLQNFNFRVTGLPDGVSENTNGGDYCDYVQGYSPIPGVYYVRYYSSFHGDLEPMPEYEKVTLTEYLHAFRQALLDSELCDCEPELDKEIESINYDSYDFSMLSDDDDMNFNLDTDFWNNF